MSNPDLTALTPAVASGSPTAPPGTMPAELAALSASTAAERESAWSRFVTSYTPLLLRVARTVMHDHDAAMDAYTFVLGQLREDDLRRLLAYRATADCSFSTWLAVVARRLCLDHYRQKYGRVRTDAPEARDAQRERRRLADLVAVEVEPQLAATNPDPAAALEQAEIINAVQAALSGLAPRDQLLLRYRFDDDLPAREIARLMRFRSVFHVYRRVNALLASCRTALAQKGIRSTSG